MQFFTGAVADDDYLKPTGLVLPVAIGWTKRGNGIGDYPLLKKIFKALPDLKKEFGDFCKKHKNLTTVMVHKNIFMFPVKMLNEENPYDSHRGEVNNDLIVRSCKELIEFSKDFKHDILIPFITKEVSELLEQNLPSDKFILCIPSGKLNAPKPPVREGNVQSGSPEVIIRWEPNTAGYQLDTNWTLYVADGVVEAMNARQAPVEEAPRARARET